MDYIIQLTNRQYKEANVAINAMKNLGSPVIKNVGTNIASQGFKNIMSAEPGKKVEAAKTFLNEVPSLAKTEGWNSLKGMGINYAKSKVVGGVKNVGEYLINKKPSLIVKAKTPKEPTSFGQAIGNTFKRMF